FLVRQGFPRNFRLSPAGVLRLLLPGGAPRGDSALTQRTSPRLIFRDQLITLELPRRSSGMTCLFWRAVRDSIPDLVDSRGETSRHHIRRVAFSGENRLLRRRAFPDSRDAVLS